MDEQRTRARESARTETLRIASEVTAVVGEFHDSRFVGYDEVETDAIVDRVAQGRFLALDRSPFYVESGGQVDDTGVIEGEEFVAEVIDSFRQDRKIIHEVRLLRGDLSHAAGTAVHARVDRKRRQNIERNHSATHLVHEALRQVLGTHLHQQGSLVAPDRLRFDFNHFEKISRSQLAAIEGLVNQKIADRITVNALNDPGDWLTIEEARRRYPNVKMFFGDKYGERVRIVEIDPKFSVELCGGTHVLNTRDIGLFKIVSESSIASGVRRIEAVTGEGVQHYIEEQKRAVGLLDEQVAKLADEVATLEKQIGHTVPAAGGLLPAAATFSAITGHPTREHLEILEGMIREREAAVAELAEAKAGVSKELSRQRVREAASSLDAVLAQAVDAGGVKVVAAHVAAGTIDELKSLGDGLRGKLGSGAGVLGCVIDEKVALVCVVTDDLIKEKNLQAGKIVGAVAKLVGGGGGGKAHLATAGGKETGKLDAALAEVPRIVGAMLG
jgi:alanyl-tRNA synthetase